MRTRRFVASLLTGLALVMGTATVSQAAPAVEAALPKCTDFSTIYRSIQGIRAHTHMPSAGYQTGNTSCVLRFGDQNAGVFVLQAAIIHCFTKIGLDAIYGRETESVVRLIQGQNGLVTDGIYGPKTRGAMRWPWYDDQGLFLGCD